VQWAVDEIKGQFGRFCSWEQKQWGEKQCKSSGHISKFDNESSWGHISKFDNRQRAGLGGAIGMSGVLLLATPNAGSRPNRASVTDHLKTDRPGPI
jgi:hypothetical protein